MRHPARLTVLLGAAFLLPLVGLALMLVFGDPMRHSWLHAIHVRLWGPWPVGAYTGTWTVWNADGTPAFVWDYVAGEPHGRLQWFRAGGVREGECQAAHGRDHGTWRVWDRHGMLRESGTKARGQREGRWTYWHSNGEKAAEGDYVGDLPSGIWRSWDNRGRLTAEGEYRGGVPWAGRFETCHDQHFSDEYEHEPAHTWQGGNRLPRP